MPRAWLGIDTFIHSHIHTFTHSYIHTFTHTHACGAPYLNISDHSQQPANESISLQPLSHKKLVENHYSNACLPLTKPCDSDRLVLMGTFHSAVLLLCTRWRHQFLVQENLCVQRLMLSSMAQDNANKTQAIHKIHNLNEYSSDLILLTRSMVCYWEAFVATPCLSHH